MIAILIILYVALVLVLFKVLRLTPTAYLIAGLIVAGVFMIGGVVVVWTQSAPITDKMVTSQYVVQLVPYVKGQVKTIHAEANQRVKKGDLLLEIDPAPYQYTVNQVEAQLASSKANVRQAEAALATAKTAVPNAQASLVKAKAANELAKTQEQIALNIQRADKAAISQLNVAKATQERQEAEAAVQQADAAVAQAQASAQQAEAAVQNGQKQRSGSGSAIGRRAVQPGSVQDDSAWRWIRYELAGAGRYHACADAARGGRNIRQRVRYRGRGRVSAKLALECRTRRRCGNGAKSVSGPSFPWKSGLRHPGNRWRPIHNQRHNPQRGTDRI